MKRFNFVDLSLPGLKLIKRNIIDDERGFLSRLFCAAELSSIGLNESIAQITHTYTRKRGTVRGMHYQEEPHCDLKIVSCIRGSIWDVVVDLRSNSPTFLKFHAQLLSEKNCYAMLIPKGFAHGFQTKVDNCELLYFHTTAHNPMAERGLRYDDPLLEINWPDPITTISQRDKSYEMMSPNFQGMRLI